MLFHRYKKSWIDDFKTGFVHQLFVQLIVWSWNATSLFRVFLRENKNQRL